MKKGVIVFALVITIVLAAFATDVSSAEGREFTYNDQLDANEKAAYDAFMELSPEKLTVLFDLPNPIYTENSLEGQSFLEQTVNDILYFADLATQMDNPVAFWTWGNSTYEQKDHYKTDVSGQLIGVTSITITIIMDSVYADDPETEENELQEKVDAVNAAVNEFTTDKTSDKEIVEDINQYLAFDNNIKYDPNLGTESENPYIHDPYGALVAWTEYEGKDYHMAVCDGYTKAFKLLCDKYDIENAMVFGVAHSKNSSENHSWNVVKIDGNWYGVDVTWNVNSSNAYMFVGSLTIINGYTFSASHVPGILKEGYHPISFYSPTLSENEIPKPGPSFIDLHGAEIILIAIVALFAISLFFIARENNKNK